MWRGHSRVQGSIGREYLSEWRCATLNVRGMNQSGKRADLVVWESRAGLDTLPMREAKVNSVSAEDHGGFRWFFSTGISPDARRAAQGAGGGAAAVRRAAIEQHVWGWRSPTELSRS